MLAISAASPIFRGVLADVDTTWAVLSAAVDCRTDEERGEMNLKNDRKIIPKSRWASVSSYLCDENQKYNDMKLVVDEASEKTLRDAGMDPIMATYFAHLWIRDPITLWRERVELDDEKESDHFQSDHFQHFQSTNYQSLRFKPPPPNSSIGWRVEFRPMEVQFTEYENAAFTIFMVLITRVLLRLFTNIRRLKFYINLVITSI